MVNYENKYILAPMVRCGTLALRLLALEYGADLVYTEEIIDLKMKNVKRTVNKTFNLIEYAVDGQQKPVFQTCEKEKGKVIFQLGTNNAQRALEVCRLIESDVAGIDINMGCPKEFSVQGGMGAALLKKPELVKEILTTLVNGCPNTPITCKIRCLPTIEETLELCRMIEKCGVKAIGVHGRFQNERSRHPNHDDYIKRIASEVKVPIIANGGSNVIKTYEDIDKFRKSCGVTSVMIARAAMWNCSIFRKPEAGGIASLDDVIKRYLEICLETNNFFFSTKYCVQQMLHEELTTNRGIAVLASLAEEEIYSLFGMLEKWQEMQKRVVESYDKEVTIIKRRTGENEENGILDVKDEDQNPKKLKVESENGVDDVKSGDGTNERNVICKYAKYKKKDFRDGTATPKSILHTYTLDRDLGRPVYTTEEKKPERVYKSIVEVNNVLYTTPHYDINKQTAEQSAAMVCLEMLNVDYHAIAEEIRQTNEMKQKLKSK